MFKTATRVTATLNALIENIKIVQGYPQITVFDKGRRSMYPEGKPSPKFISNELWVELKNLIGNRKEGKIFQNITQQDLSKLNREAFKMFIPEIEKKLTMPNHFWRHMFAQHMLRLTGWKYGIVASLGGWTVQALQESYGKPPIATIFEWGKEFVHKI
jgi:integrase